MITNPTRLILLALCLSVCGPAAASGMTPKVAARLDEIKKLSTDDPARALTLMDDLLAYGHLAEEESGWLCYEKGLVLRQELGEKDQALLSFYQALRHFRKAATAGRCSAACWFRNG